MGNERGVTNNALAALAVLLILISLVNIFVALGIIRSRAAGAVYAVGEARLCMADTPSITAVLYHLLQEGMPFMADVNATGESGGLVLYSENTSLFEINTLSGIIAFTPTNAQVGIWNVTVFSLETTCNHFADSVNITFNITNFNDPPSLSALVLQNASSGSGNATYLFPINDTVDLYEDTRYNVTLVAADPDLAYGDWLYYLAVWFDPGDGQIPDLFVLNESTGKTTFMPLQGDVREYEALFHVHDRMLESDDKNVDVVVHNVNDRPVLLNKTVLMARTAYSGEPFLLQLNATDEDGDTLAYYADSINCTKMNMSDPDCTIFTINSSSGVIDFTPVIMDVGNFTVNYSVSDGAARDWANGTFTVVEFANHPPNITMWDPYLYAPIMFEGNVLAFNITVYDPDSGWNTAAPQWFLNGNLLEGQNFYSYIFNAGYTSSGVHNVTVVVSDGEYTDYHEWSLIVLDMDRPSGGGRGAISSLACFENWRCTVWAECSAEGVQIRTCIELSNCSTRLLAPPQIQACTYSPNPTCFDGIINCHGGSCEILADCGGPCQPCPTCSDGIRNCHANGECELMADCGGPCRPCPVNATAPVCGNGICETGELDSCVSDCMDFWIDLAIFMMILVLLIVITILLYVYRKETVLLYVYRKVRGA